ncbi:unnamed protein product, partial [Owenia fusiformis]
KKAKRLRYREYLLGDLNEKERKDALKKLKENGGYTNIAFDPSDEPDLEGLMIPLEEANAADIEVLSQTLEDNTPVEEEIPMLEIKHSVSTPGTTKKNPNTTHLSLEDKYKHIPYIDKDSMSDTSSLMRFFQHISDES